MIRLSWGIINRLSRALSIAFPGPHHYQVGYDDKQSGIFFKANHMDSMLEMRWGETNGTADGDVVGSLVGRADGDVDGTDEGDELGLLVGRVDGDTEGLADGDALATSPTRQ
mmetsp:Transcript_5713/g.9373  ORF Transcript_5713/g.9373 Transcript_5713/m.9373 type:complete len:112 (-) Transcript_5713:226-561(-)